MTFVQMTIKEKAHLRMESALCKKILIQLLLRCCSRYRKRTPHGQRLLMVKCPLGCFLVYSSLLVARMRESVCTNRDFFASPSVHAKIRQGCQLSDTFRVGIRDVFHCRRHKDYHVAQLDSGRIVGMSSTSSYKPLFLDTTLHRKG